MWFSSYPQADIDIGVAQVAASKCPISKKGTWNHVRSKQIGVFIVVSLGRSLWVAVSVESRKDTVAAQKGGRALYSCNHSSTIW